MKKFTAVILMIAMLLCGAAYAESMKLLEVCPPYQTEYVDVYSDSAGNTINKQGKTFSMAGGSYREGLLFWSGYNNYQVALFNLDGKYSTMSFVLGHVDGESLGGDGTLRILLDGNNVAEYTVSPYGMPETYTLDLNRARSMIIEGGDWAYVVGMADIVVSE